MSKKARRHITERFWVTWRSNREMARKYDKIVPGWPGKGNDDHSIKHGSARMQMDNISFNAAA